jgi:hypothetical protein
MLERKVKIFWFILDKAGFDYGEVVDSEHIPDLTRSQIYYDHIMEQLTLNEFIEVCRGFYKSIDVRAILAKYKDPVHDGWKCLFLKIRLTKETQKKLEEIHTKQGHIDRPYFKVITKHISAGEISKIIREIESGYITFKDIKLELEPDDWKGISNKRICQGRELYTNNKESTWPFQDLYQVGHVPSWLR